MRPAQLVQARAQPQARVPVRALARALLRALALLPNRQCRPKARPAGWCRRHRRHKPQQRERTPSISPTVWPTLHVGVSSGSPLGSSTLDLAPTDIGGTCFPQRFETFILNVSEAVDNLDFDQRRCQLIRHQKLRQTLVARSLAKRCEDSTTPRTRLLRGLVCQELSDVIVDSALDPEFVQRSPQFGDRRNWGVRQAHFGLRTLDAEPVERY